MLLTDSTRIPAHTGTRSSGLPRLQKLTMHGGFLLENQKRNKNPHNGRHHQRQMEAECTVMAIQENPENCNHAHKDGLFVLRQGQGSEVSK